jgi:release factor glutamine methyltransferase
MTSAAAQLDAAERILAAAGVESARHDAEALLAHTLGVNRLELAGAEAPDASAVERFRRAVARRAARVPLQHLTGTAGFRYLDLEVGPGVFVPRPETEVMAGHAVDEARQLIADGVDPLVVDLCAGSGAIALCVATETAGARVVGVELSDDAHAYAVRNAARIAPEVELRLGDIASAVDDLVGQAHIVTANPPYIPLSAYESVAVEARDHDPALALWSGADGLDLIRRVSEVAARLLRPGGLLLCEHADVQGEAAPAVFAASGAWCDIRDHRDLAGRDRFVSARRAPASTTSAGTMSS